MKKVLLLLLLCGLAGCTTTSVYQRTASENRASLTKLSIGMAKEDALKVMGSDPKKGNFIEGHAVIENPYKSETVQGVGETFEVYYYLTNPFEDRGGWFKTDITYDELTPLLFKNGFLAGWGDDFLKKSIPDYELFKFRHFSTTF
ncbi:MAG: DUF3192 domain-containing protein [Candidatus Omnitrophota bacterium]